MINPFDVFNPFSLSTLASAIGSAFSPVSMFRASEQGAWYDPSDWSTLFQDSAGTLPVTAVGQPVGLMLDKRLGLVRGVNLITNGSFDSDVAGWAKIGSGTLTWSNGTAVCLTDGVNNVLLFQTILTTVGTSYEITLSRKSADSMAIYTNAGLNGPFLSSIGESRLVIKATATTTDIKVAGPAGSSAGTVDNISVRELPGNHAVQPTAINRPVMQQDGSGNRYLAFNGTNSWMSTAAIDFSGTDKMTVVAGVRKLSDAAVGMLVELSTSSTATPGTFSLRAPQTAGASGDYAYLSGGSISGAVLLPSGALPAPNTSVLTGISSIGADVVVIRSNGVQAAVSGADQGTGNFGSYPLYLGARAGTSVFFNGNFYGLILRGALSTTPQISSAEKLMAAKTGITI